MKTKERTLNAYLSATNIEENQGGYSEEHIVECFNRFKRFLVEDFGLKNAQVWIDRKDRVGLDDIWHIMKEDDFYAVDEDLTIEELLLAIPYLKDNFDINKTVKSLIKEAIKKAKREASYIKQAKQNSKAKTKTNLQLVKD